MNRGRYAIALLIAAAALPAATRPLAAHAAIPVHPAAGLPRAACSAHPGLVTLTSSGLVRAGHVRVTCPRAWRIREVVMYLAADEGGKWIFGGDQAVSGQGDTIIPAFKRPYHECAKWKLRAIFGDGDTFTGEATRFCS